MKCSNCNNERWSVVGRVGALETWRCLECGNEEVVHVNAPLSDVDVSNLEPVFHLRVEWSTAPSARDLEVFQTLFPRVKGVTLAAMVRAAREHRKIEVGRYTESELRPMAESLQSLNLKLDRVPVVTSNSAGAEV